VTDGRASIQVLFRGRRCYPTGGTGQIRAVTIVPASEATIRYRESAEMRAAADNNHG